MVRNNTITQQLVACILLISLFLQSYGGPTNLPIQGEEEPSASTTIGQEEEQEQGRRKRARIEIEQEEGQEQRLIEQAQLRV